MPREAQALNGELVMVQLKDRDDSYASLFTSKVLVRPEDPIICLFGLDRNRSVLSQAMTALVKPPLLAREGSQCFAKHICINLILWSMIPQSTVANHGR
jgi:hypothetical protein